MMGQQKRQQILQDVCTRNRHAEFFQQGLQIFLCALLTEEAKLVMKRIAFPTERHCGTVVGLRFSHPLLRQPFHREPCPAT